MEAPGLFYFQSIPWASQCKPKKVFKARLVQTYFRRIAQPSPGTTTSSFKVRT
jgi:hypothetical protein